MCHSTPVHPMTGEFMIRVEEKFVKCIHSLMKFTLLLLSTRVCNLLRIYISHPQPPHKVHYREKNGKWNQNGKRRGITKSQSIPILSYYASPELPSMLYVRWKPNVIDQYDLALIPAEIWKNISFTGCHVNEPCPHPQYQHWTCQSCVHCIVHILLHDSQPTIALLVSH